MGRCAVVEIPAVGREGWEDFQPVGLQQGREDQLVGARVEHHNVAELMISLDALALADEETLMDGVGGIGTITARGMPVGIAAGGFG